MHKTLTKMPLLQWASAAGAGCAHLGQGHQARVDGAQSWAHHDCLLSRRVESTCDTIAAGSGGMWVRSGLLPGLCKHRAQSSVVLDSSGCIKRPFSETLCFWCCIKAYPLTKDVHDILKENGSSQETWGILIPNKPPAFRELHCFGNALVVY